MEIGKREDNIQNHGAYLLRCKKPISSCLTKRLCPQDSVHSYSIFFGVKFGAKVRNFYDISKEYFKIIDFDDAAVADFAALAGGKQLDVAPASIKIVSQGDTISEFEDRAVGLPYGNIDRVAAVEHRASGGYVYRASHQEKVGLNLSLNIPGVLCVRILMLFSAYRHVNLTLLGFSSVSDNSDVNSVIRIDMSASKSIS